MRRTGWLLLGCCLALAGGVGWLFQQQKAEQTRTAPKKPNALPAGLQSLAGDGWVWSKTEGERVIVEVRAKQFAQQDEPPLVKLEQVELKLFHKDGTQFDLVKSASAELRANEGVLYADGDVEITMGLKADPEAPNRLVDIKTSGVSFDTATGKATTERKAEFTFENSTGSAVGAVYDPTKHELEMRTAVRLDWLKGAKKMHVEAGHLSYKEGEAKVYLTPWSKLERDTLTLNAADSVVSLNKGEIQLVQAEKAHGEDRQPKRLLEYAADHLTLHFGAKNTVNKIEAEQNAKLTTTAASGVTVVTSKRVDMDFDVDGGESTLTKALASGATRVESTPPAKGARILTSEIVELAMREGGQEIATVVTQTPGEIEFLPKGPAERYRKMNGERLFITYGENNQIEKFRSTKVKTFTKGKPKQADSTTTSEELLATFDPKTGEMSNLEQWTNFRYEEGDRRARSERAKLEQATEHITLTGAARVWDSTGSTDAELIELDQKSGDMVATGKVNSTRLPDKEKDPKKAAKPKSSMMDSSETIQARAGKMTTKDRNQWIRYEGAATVWQGADKLDAELITIDRKQQRLLASGKVFTQTREKPKPDAKKPAAQMFTLVRAPELDYNDAEKLAYYKGGVTMLRGDLKVTSKELKAWFSKDDPKTPEDEGNSLQRAEADGNVDIYQAIATRVRTGKSEHADYEIEEAKVTLTGGTPSFNDSLKGNTRGQKLTWFSEEDRLLVDGAASEPTVSRIQRKTKK